MNRIKRLFNWRQKLIDETDKDMKKAIQRTRNYATQEIAKITQTAEIRKRLIKCLREKPEMIFGSDGIYIRTKNHLLVHDVAKELNIKLERTAESDGFNFKSEYEGVRINVFGMQTIPHCKIVPHKEMQEITIYETVCE